MVDAAPNPGRPLFSRRCCRGRQQDLCYRRLGYRCRRIAPVILLSLANRADTSIPIFSAAVIILAGLTANAGIVAVLSYFDIL
jgi:hypothetical protein